MVTTTEEREPMNVRDFPVRLRMELKLRAIREGRKMGDLLAEAVEQYLKGGKGQEAARPHECTDLGAPAG